MSGYPDAPGHRNLETSVAAADALAPCLGRLQHMARKAIIHAGANGLTADAVSYTQLDVYKRQASIRAWATVQEDVRALVQTGSLVRHDGLADEFSDLDIEIISRDPAFLIDSDAWIDKIGSPITILRLDAEDDQQWSTRLVIFEGGIKVDFTLAGLRRVESMSGANGLDPLYELSLIHI